MFFKIELAKQAHNTLVNELVEIVNHNTAEEITQKLSQKLSQLDTLDRSFKEIIIKSIIDSLQTEIELIVENESSFAASSSGSEQSKVPNDGTIKTNLLTAFLAINHREINTLLSKYELISNESISVKVKDGQNTLEYLLNHNLEEQVNRLLEYRELNDIVALITDTSDENPLLNYYKNIAEQEQDPPPSEYAYLQGLTRQINHAVDMNNLPLLTKVFTEIDTLPQGIQKRMFFEEHITPSLASCFRKALAQKKVDTTLIKAFYQRGFNLATASDSNNPKATAQFINSERDIKTKCELLKLDTNFLEKSFSQFSIKERVQVLNLLAQAQESCLFTDCWEKNQELLSNLEEQKKFHQVFCSDLLTNAAQFDEHTLAIIYKYLTTIEKNANQTIGDSILKGNNKQRLNALNWLINSNVIEKVNVHELSMGDLFSNKSFDFYQKLIGLELFKDLLPMAYIPLIMEKQFEIVSLFIEKNIELPGIFWRHAGVNLRNAVHTDYPEGYEVLIPGLIHVTPSQTPYLDNFLKGRFHNSGNALSIMQKITSAIIYKHPEKIAILLQNGRYHKAFLALSKGDKQQLVGQLIGIKHELVPFNSSIQQLIIDAEVEMLPIDYLSHYLLFKQWDHKQDVNDKLIIQFGRATYHDATYAPFNFDMCSNNNLKHLMCLPAKNILCLMSRDSTFKQLVQLELQQEGKVHIEQLRNIIRSHDINSLATAADYLHQIAPNVDFSTELFHAHLRSQDKDSLDNLLSKFKTYDWKINLPRLCEKYFQPRECLNLLYLLVDSDIQYSLLNKIELKQETSDYIFTQWIKPLINIEYTRKETLKIQIRNLLQLLPGIEGIIGVKELEMSLAEPGNIYLTDDNLKSVDWRAYPTGSLTAMCFNVIKHNKEITEEANEKLPRVLHEDMNSSFDRYCNYFAADPVASNVTEACIAACSSSTPSTTSTALRFFNASGDTDNPIPVYEIENRII